MKELLFTMFKIGCIGFGGGTALVPVIESEVVYEKKLIDKDEYTKDVVVANITPGALPVEVAAGVGRKVCGIPGMLLSAVLMGLPGSVLAFGFGQMWIGIGLALGTAANWIFVAKRLRKFSRAAGDAITVPQYLGNRFLAKSHTLQMICAIIFFL